MKHNPPLIYLFFLLLIVALVFTAAHQVGIDGATLTPTPWPLPELIPDPNVPTRTPGWWNEIPTPVPFPSPTPRK